MVCVTGSNDVPFSNITLMFLPGSKASNHFELFPLTVLSGTSAGTVSEIQLSPSCTKNRTAISDRESTKRSWR